MNRKRRTCYHENGCGRCNGEKNTRGKIYRRCFLCAAYEPIKSRGTTPANKNEGKERMFRTNGKRRSPAKMIPPLKV